MSDCVSKNESELAPYEKEYIEFVKNISLDEVIERATKAIRIDGKKEAHQRRIPKIVLEEFYQKVKSETEEIKECKDFEQLLSIIEDCRLKGVRHLTLYDTAFRIGCKLEIFPRYIYLHAGTKTGAEAVLGKRIREKYISLEDLPDSFYEKVDRKRGEVKPYEAEVCLCAHPEIKKLKK